MQHLDKSHDYWKIYKSHDYWKIYNTRITGKYIILEFQGPTGFAQKYVRFAH